MTDRYVLGIDLGTTNSVVAFAKQDAESPVLDLLPIPQLVAAGVIEERTSLPSFLYLAGPHDGAGKFDLPWATSRDFVVGEFARKQSAEFPDRVVAAAKSWLCHNRVDRHQPILPWGAGAEIPKLSPVTASRRYLEHLIAAWHHKFPAAPFADQSVVLTVPASFDASARELTREAALAAGFPENFVLLEEPQAAVYAWIHSTGDRWRKLLKVGETLLVCDIGGGTTDLTLVGVSEENGELSLGRVAVGNHLLVGGDNMDLMLAHQLAEQFAAKNVKLDPWQSVGLWHGCRAAKEAVLAKAGSATHPVSVLGRGSKLIGGTVKIDVQRQHVADWLLNGFFPNCAVADKPKRQRMSGFQEIGLPYEHDSAITRHVAAFLQSHSPDGISAIRPAHVLLNGGVFKAETLGERLLQVMESWFPDSPAPKLLAGVHDLDHAVAKGAAVYGWTKLNGGVRIRSGAARSYYIGIETAGLAVPGAPRPLRALCVVPMGMEEGTELDVPSDPIGLIVGEPAQFRFFSSSVRKDDRCGSRLSGWSDEELIETDPLEATLSAEGKRDDIYVPVQFQTRLTELGVLELWCVGTSGQGRWKLEFSVRDEDE